MHKIIILLSLIPWFLYNYSNLCIFNNFLKGKISIIKKIPFNNIFLYIILIYFLEYYKKSDTIFIVSILLFVTIHLFLYFNNLNKREKIKKRPNFITLIFLLILAFIVVRIKLKLKTRYYILIGVSFFLYYIDKLIKKISHEKQL